MSNKIYNDNDRIQQVNWLEREADVITYYGEGTAQDLVDYWRFQAESGEFELPEWFDAHDQNLLTELVAKAIS